MEKKVVGTWQKKKIVRSAFGKPKKVFKTELGHIKNFAHSKRGLVLNKFCLATNPGCFVAKQEMLYDNGQVVSCRDIFIVFPLFKKKKNVLSQDVLYKRLFILNLFFN